MSNKIVVLNGPPGCGKDTIGVAAADEWSYAPISFKEPMFVIAAATIGMELQEFKRNYANREWKERKREEWGGKSIRDLFIAISENYIKPFFGNEYFGQQVADVMRKNQPFLRYYVATDGGFYDEINALIKEDVKVYIVHMYRDGCTFEGDSRSYINHPDAVTLRLDNNGTIDETVEELTRMLQRNGLPISTGHGDPVL